MSDKLVYDLTQETEGTPNIFIRKDWLSIMDNMNGSYQSNQSVIDTSQIANANKWMNYREAYLAVPMLLTMTTEGIQGNSKGFNDGLIGLKNWFGSIIHSLTVDYNGSTIIQQTPFINMWNSFKLITSLSYSDLITQGAVIGFYPDTAGAWTYDDATDDGGANDASAIAPKYSNCDTSFYDCESGYFGNSSRYVARAIGGGVFDVLDAGGAVGEVTIPVTYVEYGGNVGLSKRLKWITFNEAGGSEDGISSTYTTVGMTKDTAKNIWKSNVSKKVKSEDGVAGVYQVSVMATIYLKHLCSFFDMCPLLKGVFMKLTLNLNNSSSSVTRLKNDDAIKSYTSNVPSGGVQPLLIPSVRSMSLGLDDYPEADWVTEYSLSVGNKCLNNNHSNVVGVEVGNVANNIYLNVPAYSFTPTFEEAYLASSPKKITYTDVYQYQITNEISATSGTFNSLITNGLRNIKSVLIIPFIGTSVIGGGKQQFSSPFDPAGCGTTAPMVHLNNLQVQIGGQNALYNAQKYNYEEFIHQLQGANAVNGGMTDGLTSGLIGYDGFQQSYCYYYVNVERMLPVEKNVAKSVYISGNNSSTHPISLWVFVEYETEITVDLYTGARI
jgi:hypothetical protein